MDQSSVITERLVRQAMQHAQQPGAITARGWVEDDARIWGQTSGRPAAVLVPIVTHPQGMAVLLTQRTEHLQHHAGQISFPGGRVEAQDVSPGATALRETEEEIGLSSEYVEVLGSLPEYITGTGFCITPVVGLVRPGFSLTLDTFEVAEAFEVPLDFVISPSNHKRHRMIYQGRPREYYAMPYGERYIWGATAGMLVALSQIVRLVQHGEQG